MGEARAGEAPVTTCRIVRSFPHDPEAFTQGLVYSDGWLFESTGLNGRSSLRRVELETGRVVKRRDLDARYFGEGFTLWGSSIILLTWKSGVAFRYDRESFEELGRFRYAGEGWGLTHDGQNLIMSDGTAVLRFLDPVTFRERARLLVTDGGESVEALNELEFVQGEIWANVWEKDVIARISPATGKVLGWVDLGALRRAVGNAPQSDVLNGIAYDTAGERIFVTGKHWPLLFQIELAKER